MNIKRANTAGAEYGQYDWASGVAYSQKPVPENRTPEYYQSDNPMGLGRMVFFCRPLGFDNWIGPEGSKREDMFAEYCSALGAVWSGGTDGYLKTKEKESPGIKTSGTNVGKKPLQIRDSGFIDWKSVMDSEDYNVHEQNYDFPGPVAAFGSMAKRYIMEAKSYLPTKVTVMEGGGTTKSIVTLGSSQLDLSKDIADNKDAGNSIVFEGERNNITTSDEKIY